MILSTTVFGVTRSGFQSQTYPATRDRWKSRELAETFYGQGKIASGEGVYFFNLYEATAHFYLRSAGILSSTEGARPNAMFGLCVESADVYVRSPIFFAKYGRSFLQTLASAGVVVEKRDVDGDDQFAYAVGPFPEARLVIQDSLAKFANSFKSAIEQENITRSREKVKVWQIGEATRNYRQDDSALVFDEQFDKYGALYVPLRAFDGRQSQTVTTSVLVGQATANVLKPEYGSAMPADWIPRKLIRREDDRIRERLVVAIRRQRLLIVGLGLVAALEAVVLLAWSLSIPAPRSHPPVAQQTAQIAGAEATITPPAPKNPSSLDDTEDEPANLQASAILKMSAEMSPEEAQRCETRSKKKRCYLSVKATEMLASQFFSLNFSSDIEVFIFVGRLTNRNLDASEYEDLGRKISENNRNSSDELKMIIANGRNVRGGGGFASFAIIEYETLSTIRSVLNGILISPQSVSASPLTMAKKNSSPSGKAERLLPPD